MNRRVLACLALLTALALMPSCAWVNRVTGREGANQAKAVEIYGRGMAQMRSGQAAGAQRSLEQAIELDPGLYYAYYPLGLIYSSHGKRLQARRVWQTGLAKARRGPSRPEYPATRAVAVLQAALRGLDRPPSRARSRRAAQPRPVRRVALRSIRSQPKAKRLRRVKRLRPGFAVLVSSNRRARNALAHSRLMARRGYKPLVKTWRDKKKRIWHRVVVGCCTSRRRALALAKRVRAKKHAKNPVVIRLSR